MLDERLVKIIEDNAEARLKLTSLLERVTAEPPKAHGSAMDVIITPNEVNSRHGTGVLIDRLFGHCPDVLSIRSRNIYGGEQRFGAVDLCLSHPEGTRLQAFYNVMRVLAGIEPRRILCVPYYIEDVMTALAIKELFDVPLAVWVMDDQNISVQTIPDGLMGELLRKSGLRLAISPELQRAYQAKYDLPMHFVPPVVPDALLSREARLPAPDSAEARIGAIIGNIWSDRWLAMLRQTVRSTGIQVHWYWTGGSWLDREQTDRATLKRDGILLKPPIPTEAALVDDLRGRMFTVVPSGTLDAFDDNPAISRLSLPSRIVFILATTNTPIIVLGSPETAAARFVTQCGIGVVSAYEPASFRRAVERVTEPATQRSLRENAARLAPAFAARGTDEWIWGSLAVGRPSDDRFARLGTAGG
ncbi:MAG: hypothetical protein KME03_00230 [Aphanocapsa lilacina HA4352-LM1]|jgi:hypothetical protein|nr:hypothetical protein [Aphanocapsa lilacina HA4352-LM1]